MLKKTLIILLGAALVPFCIGFTWQFGITIFAVRYKPVIPYLFMAGVFTYLTVHILFRKPILTYVLGHELTHALFAMLFGGSVKAFHASEKGGRVTVTKSNFLITLAPYFFPLYTAVSFLLYSAAVAAGLEGTATWLVFLTGGTFAFHLLLTAIFLHAGQNDIQEYGMIFSFPLIYLFNVVLTALLMRLLLTENMEYRLFLGGGIMKSINLTVALLAKMYAMIMHVL